MFSKNVFINCPFDKAYFSLLKPLIFTVSYFDFNPRIALEKSDSGKPRLEKILELIKKSKYSIHDLSRLQSTKSNEFYRLNMPFELGLDYGSKTYSKNLAGKEFLILETKPFDYMKAISDINGLDIKNHNDEPEVIVECVWAWFIETVGLRKIGSPLKIWYDFLDFNTQLFETNYAKYYPKYGEHIAEKFAKVETEKIPIPEYIDEIKEFIATVKPNK
ncbi:hypothetical protein [uncultured Cyclobacterium sp.]|uniref:hypothetical protein n=1 Tax=uncultured Cyclobacterium sp. TaxID=453820 RepID=UPI0030ED5870